MPTLYPLKFAPQFEYRPWGGRRLAHLVSSVLPEGAPVGEAWLLSDRDGHASVVAEGALKGTPLHRLLEQWPLELMGTQRQACKRFPLLLKFLDVTGSLSVQVHPVGKTEGWVVLEAGGDARVFAGLKPDTTPQQLRSAVEQGTMPEMLAPLRPLVGEAILIPAGTVHCLRDLLVFEVQQNCDVTYRLYDWDRIDGRTQAPRPLQVEQALACIDFPPQPVCPVVPLVECAEPVLRERLLDCSFFGVARVHARTTFMVGAVDAASILVCIAGEGNVMHADTAWSLAKGDCMVLPAALGACHCVPEPSLTLLEVSLPHSVGA